MRKARRAFECTLGTLQTRHRPGPSLGSSGLPFSEGGRNSGKSVIQSDATGAAGTSAALPSPDRLGTECRSPAVQEKRRCRMHGGTNPGAPKGNRNAWKHGARSAKAMAAGRYLRLVARVLREEEG
jgi:hypothetical protein